MKIHLSAILQISPFFQTFLLKMVKGLRRKSHIEINGKISILPKILRNLF